MKMLCLISGVALISSNVLGMQNHLRCDDMYIGCGLTFKSSNFSDTINDRYTKAAKKNDLETVKKLGGEITLGKGKGFTRPYYIDGEALLDVSKKESFSTEFNNKFLKAVKKNDLETVKKFVGADIDVETIENIVSRSNNPKALEKYLGRRIYIKTRTDVNTQDEYGNTPLMWAARNGNQEIVSLLLGCKDTDTNIKNKDGNSALDFAIMRGFVDIISPETPEPSVLDKDMTILKKISPRLAFASVGWMYVNSFLDNNSKKINLLERYAEEICGITNIGEEKQQRMRDGAEDLVNFRNEHPSISSWRIVSSWYNSPNASSTDLLGLGSDPSAILGLSWTGANSRIDSCRTRLEGEYNFKSKSNK
jgi:hypothetical protein